MIRINTKALLLTLALATTAGTTKAQDGVETTLEADLVNQYIWRGQKLGNVSVQPTLGIEWKGLSLTAWGSVGIEKEDTKEFDLTAAYTLGGFTVGLTDYYFDSKRYFLYDAHRTSHVFEANVGYNFGPVALQWFTNIAGNDGLNKSGKRAYSSYVELSAPFRLGGCYWKAAVGAVPYYTTFYGDNKSSGFALCNLSLMATRDIRVTQTFRLPLFAGVTANPSAQKAYLLFGFTLRP